MNTSRGLGWCRRSVRGSRLQDNNGGGVECQGGKVTVLFRWLIEFEVAGSFDERATQDC